MQGRDSTKGLCQGNTALLKVIFWGRNTPGLCPKKQNKAFQGSSHSSLHIDKVRRHQNKMGLLIKGWRALFHQSQELCSWGIHCSMEDLLVKFLIWIKEPRGLEPMFFIIYYCAVQVLEKMWVFNGKTCIDICFPSPSKFNLSKSNESSVSSYSLASVNICLSVSELRFEIHSTVSQNPTLNAPAPKS